MVKRTKTLRQYIQQGVVQERLDMLDLMNPAKRYSISIIDYITQTNQVAEMNANQLNCCMNKGITAANIAFTEFPVMPGYPDEVEEQ